jgi:hypothetical protein
MLTPTKSGSKKWSRRHLSHIRIWFHLLWQFSINTCRVKPNSGKKREDAIMSLPKADLFEPKRTITEEFEKTLKACFIHQCSSWLTDKALQSYTIYWRYCWDFWDRNCGNGYKTKSFWDNKKILNTNYYHRQRRGGIWKNQESLLRWKQGK